MYPGENLGIPLSRSAPITNTMGKVFRSKRTWMQFFLSIVVFFSVLSIVAGFDEPEDNVYSMFYDSSRQFTTSPVEGITLMSSTAQSDSFLTNGESDESVLVFSFLPPAGATLSQYAIVYSCDSNAVVASDSCLVNNVEVEIIGSDATAYNTTVTCAFNRFPGSTSCRLTAAPTVVIRQDMSMPHAIVSERQSLPSYESESIEKNVFGIVFYIPDATGALSSDSVIVSGDQNAYGLETYDRTDQAVREISIAGMFPGGTAVSGSSAISFFAAANVSTVAGDQILRYDDVACSITNATIIDNVVSLPDPSTCAIGIAVPDDENPPRIGLQFRTLKSGAFSIQMRWGSFGTSPEEYEQVLNLRIIEPAPPVITGLHRGSERYRSIPCEPEILTITGFNLRFAETREIVVKNSDGSTSIWSQRVGGFLYDSSKDSSITIFESSGGLGTDVPFTVRAQFSGRERESIVLDSSILLTVSFSTPPAVEAINPPRTQADGGDTIVVTGSFEGFGENSFIVVGGFQIDADDVVLDGTRALSFTSPSLSNLGKQFNFPVVVSICAETSAPQTLTYAVPPVLTLTVVDSSPDESGQHLVPSGGSLSFVAVVSGNNEGVQYFWNVFNSAGEDITASDRNSNAQVFTIGSNELPSNSETYTIKVEVRNSLDLRDSKQVRARVASSSAELVIAKIYPVEELFRSSKLFTLVQASVTLLTSSGAVVALQDTDLVLEWAYRGRTFKVDTAADNTPVNSSVTGPTQLGLEFNIAQADLILGTQELALDAHLSSNRDVKAVDKILLTVISTPLRAYINDGINGSLVLSSSDLSLSAGKSADPDILKGEGDNTVGLVYEWISCKKSLVSSFRSGTQDCNSILPSDSSVSSFNVSSPDLEKESLDNSSDPNPTFISFGLRIRKGRRASETYLYFEIRALPSSEKVPRLDSLDLVDSRGQVISRTAVDSQSEVIIQPTAISDPNASWTYDMASLNQRFLFSKSGVLRTGTGFVSLPRQKSRRLLGFSRNSLNPSTQYAVRVTVSASDASIESDYELTFTTDDVPKLSCTAPQVTTGTISETKFTISAQLSFQSQGIEYCFYLVSSKKKKFAVGKGCSSVSFATFTFPAAGRYGIECHAKTASGGVIEVVTLDTSIVLATPTPSPGSTALEALTDRLTSLDNQVTACQASRDHKCIESLISVAVDITDNIAQTVSSDSSNGAVALKEAAGDYIVRLSTISEQLADRTVFSPNQVENSIDQTLSLAEVPADMFQADSTVFSMLKQAQHAVSSTESNSAQPIIGTEVVDKMSAVANLTLSASYSLAQGGSSRSRLSRQGDITRSSYAVTVQELPQYIAQMRMQQESCGYFGRESTRFPTTLSGTGRATTSSNGNILSPIDINLRIICTSAQASEPMVGELVSLKVCENAFVDRNRMAFMVAEITKQSVLDTGFVTEVDHYPDIIPHLIMTGDKKKALPDQCLELRIKWNPSRFPSTSFDQNIGGRLLNLISLDNPTCSPSTCYTLDVDEEDSVDFTTEPNMIVLKTKNEGLFVAGNRTRIASSNPANDEEGGRDSINGVGGRSTGAILRVIGVIAAFAVVATVGTWLAVTGFCVVASVDEPVATNWEYLERDMFGRGLQKNAMGQTAEISDILPSGARPPLYGPLSGGP